MTTDQPNRKLLTTDDPKRRLLFLLLIGGVMFGWPLPVLLVLVIVNNTFPALLNLLTAALAVVALSVSVILVRQRIKQWVLVGLLVIVGLLLILNASLRFTYDAMIPSLSEATQHGFENLLDVIGLTQAIGIAITGLGWLAAAWMQFPLRQPQSQASTQIPLVLRWSMSILFAVLAVFSLYSAINFSLHALRL